MLQAIGWLVATIVLVFIEATTFNLVSVWFAVGGAAALISCLFTDSLQAALDGETVLYRVEEAGFAPVEMEAVS